MGKLYVIGLGGAGARVIRSLTLLMAAGVTVNADKIIPILIDSDVENGDLARTVALLQLYHRISSHRVAAPTKPQVFYGNRLEQLIPDFKAQVPPTILDHSLQELLGVDELKRVDGSADENRALVDSLFSVDELQGVCAQGFEGNAKLGSMLFHQFLNREFKRSICHTFEEGDKLFIIGSTFGGTGAAGLAQLIDRLRFIPKSEYPNATLIKNSQIGALYVMPYFKVQQEVGSPIDSFTFTAKSKAILHYFQGAGVTESLDQLYTLGDTAGKLAYKHVVGGKDQINPAHFVELAGALAVVHFAQQELQVARWDRRLVRYMEYGLAVDQDDLSFKELPLTTLKLIQRPLIHFFLFSQFALNTPYLEGNEAWHKRIGLANKEFIDDMKKMSEQYIVWLKELASNNRSFAPFHLQVSESNVFDCIRGYHPIEASWGDKLLGKVGYRFMNAVLNRSSKRVNKEEPVFHQFIELLDLSMRQVVNEKYIY